jgi:hypothetical protein
MLLFLSVIIIIDFCFFSNLFYKSERVRRNTEIKNILNHLTLALSWEERVKTLKQAHASHLLGGEGKKFYAKR